MSFALDLPDVARSLARLDEEPPRQATLRRAVSTAYYALFHLLIGNLELGPSWNYAHGWDAPMNAV